MRIALISLDQVWLDKTANFNRCRELACEALGHGCDLVVFPEMTLTGYALGEMASQAELLADSVTLMWFAQLAAELQQTIIYGASLIESVSNSPRNQLCVATPDGNSTPVYSKIHPFSFAGENEVIEAGDQLGVIQLNTLHIATSICYDLRFPELYSAQANACNAAVVIANWPARRIAHWRALLVARAIENQMFMIGVNRIGEDGNQLMYEKSSMLIQPDGDVLEPLFSDSELDVFEIDPAAAARYRTEFPTLSDKRYSLYQTIFEQINHAG